MNKTNWLPCHLTYTKGHSITDPDPLFSRIAERMAWLNEVISLSGMVPEVCAAALKLLQTKSGMDVASFWTTMITEANPALLSEMAERVAHLVAKDDRLPRLDFPNAIAMVDCRFLSNAEWVALRRYSIGGSEASTIMGTNRFQTPRSLFNEKTDRFSQEPESKSKQYIFGFGHTVEDAVIDLACKKLGAIRRPEYRMFAHRDYPMITCNPDAILQFPDGRLCLYEAKTATRFKKDDWTQEIPPYYLPQPTQYMEVLNDPKISGGYIGCCFGLNPYDFVMHEYKREESGKQQIEKEVNFWNDYIVPDIAPPLSGNAELDMEVVYRDIKPGDITQDSMSLPADCESLAEEWRLLEAQRKETKGRFDVLYKQEKLLKAQIEEAVGEEPLTIITQPNEPSYRISFKKSRQSVLRQEEIEKAAPITKAVIDGIVSDMTEPESIQFNAPKITIKAQKKSPSGKGKTK